MDHAHPPSREMKMVKGRGESSCDTSADSRDTPQQKVGR